MSARPPFLPALLLQLAVAGGLIAGGMACGNIGLSTVPGASGEAVPAGAAHVPDAAADAGPGATTPADGADVLGPTDGGLPTTVGNPLCFVSVDPDGGGHRCLPDTSSLCAPPPDGGEDDGSVLTACHVTADGQRCEAPGTSGDGEQCTKSTECADSFECVGSPGQCRHYCCGGNATCDQAANVTTGATFCDVQPTTSGGQNVPVCEPITSCTLLLTGTGNGSCPQGETCEVVKDDGTTSCVATGPVAIGGDCDVYHCAADLTCLGPMGGRTCFQLCQVAAPSACPYGTTCTSSAQLFTNASVGICQ